MFVLVQENQAYCDTAGKKWPSDVQSPLPTLIFIHGAHHDHSVWNKHSHSLAKQGYNVFSVDLPGHGRSLGSALTTVEEMAQWLLDFLDAVGIAKAILIGHSMGSLIALEAAHCAPDRVIKLGLLGNAYPMKVADILLSMALQNESAAIDMVAGWSHYTALQNTAQLQKGTKRLMQRMSAINPTKLLHTDLSACNNYRQGEAAAAVIQCPTLFIMAQQDRMTPAKASAQLRAAISEARIVEITECGHAMMSEQPEAVLVALTSFLTST